MTVRCLVWHICLTRFLLGPRHFITPSTSVPGTCMLPLMLSGGAAAVSCRRPLRKTFLFTRLAACPCLKTLSCVAPATCEIGKTTCQTHLFFLTALPCTALAPHFCFSSSLHLLCHSRTPIPLFHTSLCLCASFHYTHLLTAACPYERKSLTPLSNTFEELFGQVWVKDAFQLV